jgi:hypothetical protein
MVTSPETYGLTVPDVMVTIVELNERGVMVTPTDLTIIKARVDPIRLC